MREVTMTIRIKLRHPIPRRELRTHVKEAVESWGGGLHPDDPLFDGIVKVVTAITKED
jgi:hypothetical protein